MAISDGDRHEAYLSRVHSPVPGVADFVAMLRRRAALIAAVTVLCAGMSLAYILLAPPKYVASGRILLDPPSPTAAGSRSDPRGETESNAIAIQNQIKVMTSRSVLDQVIAREKLETDPRFGARARGVLTALLTSIGIVPAADPNAMALRQLNSALSVISSPGSFVVNVDVLTSDGDRSARVANAVMESYIEEEARVRAETSSRPITAHDPRMELLQARLREAEQRYEAYRKDGELAAANDQSSRANQTAELSSRIAEAEAKVSGLRAALTQLQRARDERDFRAIPESLRTETLNALKDGYLAASRIEADLLETAGPRNADVKLARQQMAEITRMLDQAIGELVQSNTSELERSRQDLTRFKAELETSKKDQAASNDASTRLKELERDVETSRAAYQVFVASHRDLGDQRRSERPVARIVSRAAPPLERSGASPIRTLLISIVLGLGLAISLAWLIELMGQRKRTATSQ